MELTKYSICYARCYKFTTTILIYFKENKLSSRGNNKSLTHGLLVSGSCSVRHFLKRSDACSTQLPTSKRHAHDVIRYLRFMSSYNLGISVILPIFSKIGESRFCKYFCKFENKKIMNVLISCQPTYFSISSLSFCLALIYSHAHRCAYMLTRLQTLANAQNTAETR